MVKCRIVWNSFLYWPIHSHGQKLSLVLPRHFDVMNIVQILDTNFISSGNAEKRHSRWCLSSFWYPVRQNVILWRPQKSSHAWTLDRLLVQQTTMRHFIDGDAIGRLSRKIARIRRPLQVGPLELTGFVGQWDGKLSLLRLVEDFVNGHGRMLITTTAVSGYEVTLVGREL